ncbi:hypothetical protein RB653_005006 [Dictyostelium firmibasis]|uniref:EGF-like domain-containing protein n=1 Tax=Dictyostelium firmibasis TaxID=79012 RepID=A0AAN7UKB5_9MYCE
MSKGFIFFILFTLLISNIASLKGTEWNVPSAESVLISKNSKNVGIVGYSFGSNISDINLYFDGKNCIIDMLLPSRIECHIDDNFKTFNKGDLLNVSASIVTSIFETYFIVPFLPGSSITYSDQVCGGISPQCVNGYCDSNTLSCQCDYGYTGTKCQFIQHYVTDLIVKTKEKGMSNDFQYYLLVGNFDVNSNIDIMIGGEPCDLENKLTSNEAHCKSKSTLNGLKSIKVTQNYFDWSGLKFINSQK